MEATINVPTASIPPGGDTSGGTTYGGVGWVGIDGANGCSTLLQTGIEWEISGSTATYSAWYEWVPGPLTTFEGFTVNPGDSVAIKVVATSTTAGTAYVTNESTGEATSYAFTDQPALCQGTAEWIVEDFSVNGGEIAFADFTPVTLSAATGQAASGTIGPGNADTYTIVENGVTFTSESMDDSDVTVNWVSSG